MPKYKGIEVSEILRDLLPHMPLLDGYREELQTLQAAWENLDLLGQLSGATADIGHARQAFAELTTELLNSLGQQSIALRRAQLPRLR